MDFPRLRMGFPRSLCRGENMTFCAITLSLVVMVVGGLLGAQEAFGCSCVERSADEKVAASEAAFEGVVLEVRDSSGPGELQSSGDPVDVRFRVEAVYAGSLGDEVTVRTARSSASCGLGGLEPGQRIALALDRDEQGRWTGGSCGRFDSEDLSDPGAPPEGDGAPALDPRVVATEQRPTTVSAHGGRLAWSRYVEEIDAYVLMTEVDGQVSRVPVAPRDAPFDVDLGPHGAGEPTIAVYSRCKLETPLPLGRERRRPPEACDLYSYDFAAASETKLDGPSTDQASEYLPTVWRNTIAFARVYEQREGKRGVYPYLYTRPFRVSGSGLPPGSQRQPGGARGLTGRPGPTALDLYGSRLGVAWGRRLDGGGYRSTIRLVTRGQDDDRRVVARLASSGETVRELVSPSFANGRLFWASRQPPTSRVARFFDQGIDDPNITRFAGAPTQTLSAEVLEDTESFAYVRRSDAGFEVGVRPVIYEGAVSQLPPRTEVPPSG